MGFPPVTLGGGPHAAATTATVATASTARRVRALGRDELWLFDIDDLRSLGLSTYADGNPELPAQVHGFIPFASIDGRRTL
jgi:hypothetical protein